MSRNPIFIHSLFRTGSTYIWSKFRQDDRYYCYYEPFHQSLPKLTVNNIENLMTKDFGSVNHPSLTDYYLYEYKPLLENANLGLPYFRKTFSFDEFCYNEVNADLKKYIDRLAMSTGDKVPVLQFNRSALRLKWFKQNYPDSLHIYLVRNPRDQWQSYFEVYKKTNYGVFFVMDLLIASVNKEKQYFKPLSCSLPLLEYHNSSYDKEENFYQVILDSYSEEEKYFIFYYTWFRALVENVLYADFILDINLLSRGPVYRENVLRFLTDHGIDDIDFNDANISEYPSYQLSSKIMDKIEKKAQHLALQSVPVEQENYFFEKISTFDLKCLQFNRNRFLALKKKGVQPISHLKSIEKFEKMILSLFEDFFQKKEQNRVLLTSLNNEKNVVNQKEKLIVEINRQLAQKDEQLKQKDNLFKQMLEKKDQQLAQRDDHLKQKDNLFKQMLEKKDQQLAFKDQQLSKKDEHLAFKDRQLSKKDEHLAQKDEMLKQVVEEKGKLLNEKNQQLTWKDHQLGKKDEELAKMDYKLKLNADEKDKLLEQKDNQLELQELQLDKKDQQLEEMERQLREKIQQLKTKEEYIQNMRNSYAYKTGELLLFPFIKLKRMIQKKKK